MTSLTYNCLVRPLIPARSKPEHDRAVILAALRRFGPLSRVEIGRLTRLRPNTVSTLARELLCQGEILEAGPNDNPKGRKQVLLRLNERRGFLAGVEFDSEGVIAVAMDLRPKVLSVVREVPDLEDGIQGLTNQLFACVRSAIAAGHVEGLPLMGIAVADPGLVDSRRGVSTMSSLISFWKDVPLAKMFREEFGVETLVESATRAKAVAERVLGAGEMADEMVFVEYGAGIGGAVITQGRPPAWPAWRRRGVRSHARGGGWASLPVRELRLSGGAGRFIRVGGQVPQNHARRRELHGGAECRHRA
jgi:hypothetical protein